MKNVTLKDVAHAAGVHASTASRALDPAKADLVDAATRRRVQLIAGELGYLRHAVASGLRRGRTNTLGVIVADLANPFVAPVIRGIENSAEGKGLMPFIAESQDDHDRFERVVDHMLQRRVDGVITTAARSGDEEMLRTGFDTIPVVLAVRDLAGSGLPRVTHDDDLGGRLAAAHLLELGHRRMGQLRGPTDISSFVDRGRGFDAAAAAGGAEVIDSDDVAALPSLDEGRRLMRRLLEMASEMPTAIFAHNDLMAVGALDELAARGIRCPQDVAIMGYNDTVMSSHVEPPLSTIRLNGYEVGQLAAAMALQLIADPTLEPPERSIDPVLVPRASTLGRGGA
jgi:LacI family transcriptional regulator